MDHEKLRYAVDCLQQAFTLFEEAGESVVAARLGDIIDGLNEASLGDSPHHLLDSGN